MITFYYKGVGNSAAVLESQLHLKKINIIKFRLSLTGQLCWLFFFLPAHCICLCTWCIVMLLWLMHYDNAVISVLVCVPLTAYLLPYPPTFPHLHIFPSKPDSSLISCCHSFLCHLLFLLCRVQAVTVVKCDLFTAHCVLNCCLLLC